MEDNKKDTVTQTGDNTEGTVTEPVEKTGTEEGKGSAKVEKTFTQEEVNAMLKRERKKLPSDEELKAFKAYQDSKKTEDEKKSEREAEYQKTLAEKEDLMKENLVFKKGVSNSDDVEFLVYKISKMDGDFEDNLDAFLKEHPSYLKSKKEEQDDNTDQEKSKETTGVKVNNGSVKTESGVDAILKSRHPDLYKD